MAVIHRNVTRTILNSTEETYKTKTPASNTLSFALTTTDKFYVGFKKKFGSRYFHFATANTNSSVISVKSWDGSAFVDVEDLVDQTLGFTQSGFLSWINNTTWKSQKLSPVDDRELFWVEITVSADLSAGTELQSVLNLFCDDELVSSYYPEIINDSRYLPPGKTDFIKQYLAAKDLVVLRLKQDHLIDDEAQIMDINEVAISAVHAFAYILLNPIAVDDEDKDRAMKAFNEFNRELNEVKIDVDWDESGIIEEDEKDFGNIFIPRL